MAVHLTLGTRPANREKMQEVAAGMLSLKDLIVDGLTIKSVAQLIVY